MRLEQGDYARETVFDADPVAAARRLCAGGAPRIHVVDLDAARDGGASNGDMVLDILQATPGVPVQVGGGVRTLERIAELLASGADRVVIGTAALEEPSLLDQACARYPGRIVLGLDARGGRVAVRGWRETSERSAQEVLERFCDLPLGAVLHTDIERDGMMRGPNLAATVELARATPHPMIASGGVSCVQDLVELAKTGVIAGAIVGRAVYSGALRLEDALREVAACTQSPVRPI